MKKQFKIYTLGLAMLFGTAQAQQSVNTTGGDASGSGGSVSYSVGQVVYTYHSSTSGKMNQGVQQVFSTCETVEGIDQIDSCAPITWIDGITYTENNNTATFLLEGAALNGCDSLVTLNFTLWPCTQLNSTSCNASGVGMSQNVRAINVNAPEYRFRIIGENGGNWPNNTMIYTAPNGNRHFKPHFLSGILWNTTYTVEVAIGDGNGNWSPYGEMCTITTETTPPLTQVEANQCESTVQLTEWIYAIQTQGAAGYRFRVEGANTGGSGWNDDVFIINPSGTTRRFRLSQVGSVIPGETYSVSVAILEADGNWGDYGPACDVTLFGITELVLDDPDNDIFQDNKSMVAIEFGANASHNPFTTDFGVQILNANDQEPIAISIYDMSGKLIERNAITPMDMETARFGANLAAGMYMIEVRQGSNQALIRQVKN